MTFNANAHAPFHGANGPADLTAARSAAETLGLTPLCTRTMAKCSGDTSTSARGGQDEDEDDGGCCGGGGGALHVKVPGPGAETCSEHASRRENN